MRLVEDIRADFKRWNGGQDLPPETLKALKEHRARPELHRQRRSGTKAMNEVYQELRKPATAVRVAYFHGRRTKGMTWRKSRRSISITPRAKDRRTP